MFVQRGGRCALLCLALSVLVKLLCDLAVLALSDLSGCNHTRRRSERWRVLVFVEAMEGDEDIPILVEAEPVVTTPAQPHTVPLTIICGFLGAGKSTLVKRILTERHGYRIAVIMNEFGDTADIEGRKDSLDQSDVISQLSSEDNQCFVCRGSRRRAVRRVPGACQRMPVLQHQGYRCCCH